jgi:alpha-tubulin suppressor-like RCC1 family protein
VTTGGHFTYALDQDTNEFYAWGMGYSYVLGTKQEENEVVPKKVHPM